ncbi:tenascin-X-like [Pomacea canaliculata]|uniref:tenascin-X-like n=1 Tax=Pomacea canaliculata TaxID=400727 RepID=UPI000D728B91|nr:tenascin-X-like [Pomacea canaliculata]
MQAILLVTVFSCLLAAVAAIDPGAVGGTCLPNDKCTDGTSVCESNTCRIKAGAACTSSPTNCVSQSTCNTKCTCNTGFTEQSTGLCTAAAGAVAGAVGGTCLTGGTCTEGTSVCESNTCKIKAGATCTASPTQCVSQSTCSTTCNCDSGYNQQSTGLCKAPSVAGAVGGPCLTGSACTDGTSVCESSVCKIKAGATCTAPTTDCVSQSTCFNNKCTCGTGYTAESTGVCSRDLKGGVALQSVSSSLLIGSIITCLVTLSLP